MKVAYFALSEVYGGHDAGFVHAHSVVSCLGDAGVDVELFTGAPAKGVKADVGCVFAVLPKLSNVFLVNPVSYVWSFFEVRRKLRGVDVVHERFHVNPVDMLFLGSRKYVLEVNDPAIELAHGFKRVLYKWLVRMKYDRADAIVVQTETLKKIVSRHTDTPVYVVPNGVDTARFRPDVRSGFRKKYGFSKSDVVVTFVGSFREWHGVLDVVRMAKRLSHVKFLLVGSGRLFSEVRSAADGVSNVVLAGDVDYDEVPGIMASSDVLVAPFSTEGFAELKEYGFFWCPVKLFEYMASGRAVVSYGFSEVRKIVGDGGVLSDAGDFEGFVDNVRRLADDEKLRDELGRRARGLACKGYGWEKRVGELIRIYKALELKRG